MMSTHTVNQHVKLDNEKSYLPSCYINHLVGLPVIAGKCHIAVFAFQDFLLMDQHSSIILFIFQAMAVILYCTLYVFV